MNPLWSWLLAAVGITGLWLAGRNNKLGWAIGLFAQVLWLTYGIATRQPGFIATAFAYAFVYGRNWWRWRKQEIFKAEIARLEEERGPHV